MMEHEPARGAQVKTTCPYCGVGCGVLAKRRRRRRRSIVRGDPDHPANFGRLCSKGAALGETIGLDGRLLSPEIGGREADWDEALDLVAAKFSDTIAAHGPDSVAFYVSGQLLTEDYYVANKLMKGFIGSANIDTNSRLCMASSVAGHRRAFGSDTVPGTYRGSRAGRSRRAGRLQPRLVPSGALPAHRGGEGDAARDADRADRSAPHDDRGDRRPASADPQPTATWRCSAACSPISREHGAHRPRLCRARTRPGSRRRSRRRADADARRRSPSRPARRRAARRVLRAVRARRRRSSPSTARASTSRRAAPTRSTPSSIVISRPAASASRARGPSRSPGSRTPWADARSAASPTCSRRIWRSRTRRIATACSASGARRRSPSKPGLKAVDMFRAVADGRIKALWIMATNPVDSMPEADEVEQALRDCPVRRRLRRRPRHRHDPPRACEAAGGGLGREGRHRHQFRAAHLPPARVPAAPGEARPDWWIVCEVAKRMGFGDAFAYASPAEIFAEHAALSAFENDGTRDFDIGASPASTGAATSACSRFNGRGRGRARRRETRFFANGGFYTPDRKARIVVGRATCRSTRPTRPFRSCSTRAASATTGTP